MSQTTLVKLGDKARAAILRGVNAVYEPVRLTLGPEGGNALMYRTYGRGPRITNDGVTIAEVIEPKDEHERLAAHAFKEMAKRTNERAGDGTTGTIVIGGALINELFNKTDEVEAGFKTAAASPVKKKGVMTLSREILAEAKAVEAEIRAVAKPVDSLEVLTKIATVSVEDPELGKTIANMAWEVGLDGFIDTLEGYTDHIETEIIKGMRFPAKVGAKAFVNNPARYEMVAEDCPVLVTNIALDNAAQVGAFTKHLSTTKLIIIAPSFSDNVLVNMVQATKNGFFVFPVKAPALRSEQFEDIATYFGAQFIDKSTGKRIETVLPHDLGFVERLIVKDTETREDAVATGGAGTRGENSDIHKRIETLKAQVINMHATDIHKKLTERRIASLASAVGIIRVGAPSQAEILYLKHKIEDAVYACKAALEEGYVPGGGLCLRDIAEARGKDSILYNALRAPYEQIQANADGQLEVGEDIIDPAKAIRLEVEHATSVASKLLTTKISIPEERDHSPAEGYESIGAAITIFARYFARQHGLLKDADLEAEQERAQLLEQRIAEDNG